MKARPKPICVVVLLLVSGLGGGEVWLQRHQERQIAGLKEDLRLLQSEAEHGKQERDQTQHELDAARAASNQPPPEVDQLLATDLRSAWLSRTRELKRLFTARPDQAIPELRLLEERDWLALGKSAHLDREEDIRKALAGARTRAKNLFVGSLASALRRYNKQSGEQLPATIEQLIPFFDATPDLAMLQRYTMTRGGTTAGNPLDWAIEEREVIEEAYDSHFHVQAAGGYGAGSGKGNGLFTKLERALRSYRQANPTAPEPPEANLLLPYFSSPLSPGEMEQFQKFDKQSKR